MKNVTAFIVILSVSFSAHAISMGNISTRGDVAAIKKVYQKKADGRYQVISVTGGEMTVLEASRSGKMAELLGAMGGGDGSKKGDVIQQHSEETPVEKLNQNLTVNVSQSKSGQIVIAEVTTMELEEVKVSSVANLVLDVKSGSVANLKKGGKVVASVSTSNIKKFFGDSYKSKDEMQSSVLNIFVGPMYEASGYPGKLKVAIKTEATKLPKSVSCEFTEDKITCVTSVMQVKSALNANWSLF